MKKDKSEEAYDKEVKKLQNLTSKLVEPQSIWSQSQDMTTTTSTSYPSYPHQHTIYPNNNPQYNYQPPFIPAPPAVQHIRMNGSPELEMLVKMLKVEPGGSEGILIEFGTDGKYYSLAAILKAQMEFMMRMNTILMHRDLGESNG